MVFPLTSHIVILYWIDVVDMPLLTFLVKASGYQAPRGFSFGISPIVWLKMLYLLKGNFDNKETVAIFPRWIYYVFRRRLPHAVCLCCFSRKQRGLPEGISPLSIVWNKRRIPYGRGNARGSSVHRPGFSLFIRHIIVFQTSPQFLKSN